MSDHAGRWAWAEVDLDAIAANVELLRTVVAPAGVWAVVKADGYGHGAAPVARAALGAGAGGLCVALASEGVALRRCRGANRRLAAGSSFASLIARARLNAARCACSLDRWAIRS